MLCFYWFYAGPLYWELLQQLNWVQAKLEELEANGERQERIYLLQDNACPLKAIRKMKHIKETL